MPDPRQHADNRNLVESILRFIPGFRGYLEKEYRRESDQLARTWIADRLLRCQRGLDSFTRTLVDAGNLDDLPECERLRTELDHLRSRILAAVHGYSGAFDFVRVDENLLDTIHEYEITLLETVENLAKHVEALAASGELSPDAMAHLFDELDRIAKQWNHRNDLLKGLGD